MRVQGDKDSNHGAASIVVKNNNFISFGYSKNPDANGVYQLTNDNEAAFKIYGEATYAPKDGKTLDEINDAALIAKQKALSDEIYKNNSFGDIVLNHGKFYTTNFWDACYNQLTK